MACTMGIVCLICLVACILSRVDYELLAVGFITGVWAVTDFYDAFHRKPIEERVVAFLLPVGVTLAGAVLFLFLLLLCVNLYYEKRG